MAVEKPIIGLNPVNLPRIEYTKELAPVQEKGQEDLDIEDSPYWEEYWKRRKKGGGFLNPPESLRNYHEILPKQYRETFKFVNLRVARYWAENHMKRIRSIDPNAIPKIKILRKGKYVYASTAELRKMGFLDNPVRKKTFVRKQGETLKVGIVSGRVNVFRQQDLYHAKKIYTGHGPKRQLTKRMSYRQMHKQHDEILKQQRKMLRELKRKKIPFNLSPYLSTAREAHIRTLNNFLKGHKIKPLY